MTTRYTQDQTDSLIAAYKAAKTDAERKATVVAQAKVLGKSTQSIISKLSREGVYIKPEQAKKDLSDTKGQYINHIALMLDIRDTSRLDSLEKVSKQVLMLVSNQLNKLNDRSDEARGDKGVN